MSEGAADQARQDRSYMQLALREACRGLVKNEVPVGAVIVYQDEVIGTGFNRREERQEPTAHAEILALRDASHRLKCWRLEASTLYVTLEPCMMCAGALVQARVARVVFGCCDPKAGALESLYRVCEDPRLNHNPQVTGGVLEDDCARLLSGFFARLRGQKQSTSGVWRRDYLD